jgi:ABC-type lipoprotein export system ATPase subunit
MKIFQELNRTREITIVLITHSDEIAAYADRIIRFLDGRVVSDESITHAPRGNGQMRFSPRTAEVLQ